MNKYKAYTLTCGCGETLLEVLLPNEFETSLGSGFKLKYESPANIEVKLNAEIVCLKCKDK